VLAITKRRIHRGDAEDAEKTNALLPQMKTGWTQMGMMGMKREE